MALEEVLIKNGADVVRCPIGQYDLVQSVVNNRALLGIQTSGHYCLPTFNLCDDGLMFSLKFIEILSNSENKLSEILKELPVYPIKRDDLECKDSNKFEIMRKIVSHFKNNYDNVDTMDGIKIKLDDTWILIRASNTEPLIRLVVESKTQKKLEKTMDETKKEISKFFN